MHDLFARSPFLSASVDVDTSFSFVIDGKAGGATPVATGASAFLFHHSFEGALCSSVRIDGRRTGAFLPNTAESGFILGAAVGFASSSSLPTGTSATGFIAAGGI